MNNLRRQLTLFADENQSGTLEQIRNQFNPAQSKLIKAHVTLCKEDEMLQVDKIIQAFTNLRQHCITLRFEAVTRFAGGKGVMLPSGDEDGQFQQLREIVLQDVITNPYRSHPHFTLMHPRNSTCTDNIFEQIKMITLPNKFQFKKISLIEQETGAAWRILREFPLTEAAGQAIQNGHS